MRVIEHRAWIDDSSLCNDMEIEKHLDEYGNFIPFMQNLNNWYMDDGQTLGDFLDSFRGNLMQYTGIKDKNGVKIYENDILKYIDFRNEESIILQVWWDEENSCFNFGNRSLSMIRNKIEVIGNMCENPELLEGD